MDSPFLGKASIDNPQVNDSDSSFGTISAFSKSRVEVSPVLNRLLLSNSEVANACHNGAIVNSDENTQFSEIKIHDRKKRLKRRDSAEDFVQQLAYNVETLRTASICAIEMIREKISRFRRHAISFKNDQSQHDDTTINEASCSIASKRTDNELIHGCADTLREKMIENTNRNREVFSNFSLKEKVYKEDKQTNICFFAVKTLQEKAHLTELSHLDCRVSLADMEKCQKENAVLDMNNSPSNQALKISSKRSRVENTTNITGSASSWILDSCDGISSEAPENESDIILSDSIKTKVEDIADKLFEQSDKFNMLDVEENGSVKAGTLTQRCEQHVTEWNNSTPIENVSMFDSIQDDLSQDEVDLDCCDCSNSPSDSVNKSILHNTSKQNPDDDILTTNQAVKDNEATDRRSINLRKVKNSVEQHVVEVQYDNIIGNEGLGHRISINTDRTTEASPLSSPSPLLTSSQEKSPPNSDGEIDNEDKTYFIMDRRLSPVHSPSEGGNSTSFNASKKRRNIKAFVDPFRPCVNVSKECNCTHEKLAVKMPNQGSNRTTTSHVDKLSKPNRTSEVNGRQLAVISRTNSFSSAEVQLEKGEVLNLNFRCRSASLPLIVYKQVNYDQLLKENFLKKKTDSNSQHLNLDNEKSGSSPTSPTKTSKKKIQCTPDDNIFSDDVFIDTSNNNWMTKPQLDQNLILELAEKSSGKLARRKTTQPKNSLKLSKADTAQTFKSKRTKPSLNKKSKSRPKSASVHSSVTSSPTSSQGYLPDYCNRRISLTKSVDESDDSASSQASSRSFPSMQSITRFFRGRKKLLKRKYSAPTFCGYTLDRDYSIDYETDRIFKEFLCNERPLITFPSVNEDREFFSSDVSPSPRLKNNFYAEFRRNSLTKEYSDSIATYHRHNQRNFQFATNRGNIINHPIDRDTLLRQNLIEEEFDDELLESSRFSTSSSKSGS